MATAKCGTAELTYSEDCEFSCWCPKGGKQCVWTLTCPGSDGEDVGFSGTGLEINPGDDDEDDGRPPRPDHIAFDGTTERFVAFVREHAGRRLDVPKHLVGRRIRLEVEGDWDDAIRAAGFGKSGVRERSTSDGPG